VTHIIREEDDQSRPFFNEILSSGKKSRLSSKRKRMERRNIHSDRAEMMRNPFNADVTRRSPAFGDDSWWTTWEHDHNMASNAGLYSQAYTTETSSAPEDPEEHNATAYYHEPITSGPNLTDLSSTALLNGKVPSVNPLRPASDETFWPEYIFTNNIQDGVNNVC